MISPDTLRTVENFRLSDYRVIVEWPNNQGSDIRYKNVPIEHLEDAKRILRNRFNSVPEATKVFLRARHKRVGNFRIRYRGPRLLGLGDTRPQSQRKQDCLKRFATRFTVYIP